MKAYEYSYACAICPQQRVLWCVVPEGSFPLKPALPLGWMELNKYLYCDQHTLTLLVDGIQHWQKIPGTGLAFAGEEKTA